MSTATAEQLEVAWPPDNKAVLAERAQRLLRLRNSSRAMEAAMVYYKTHWADFIKLSARQAREAELMRKRKWANRRTRNQGT